MPSRKISLAAIILLLCLAFCPAAPVRGAEQDALPATPEALVGEMNHAETYYWIAMAERGSTTALKHGLEHLRAAYAILGQLPEATRSQYAEELDSLRADLENQYELSRDTLYGVFPLTRFFTPSIFSYKHSTGSFELLDSPPTIAVREGVENLIEHVLESQTVIPQYDVLFVSDPHDVELENEALYLFNLSARFFVHNLREVSRTLDDDELAECRNLKLSAATHAKLMSSLGASSLLLVRLKQIDTVQDEYFYSAEARLFGTGAAQPQMVFNNYGFTIDRRPVLPLLGGMHLALALLSVAVYFIAYRWCHFGSAWPAPGNAAAVALAGYCWGRFLVWMIVPVFFAMQPSPERLALWSAWWPLVTGMAILLAPVVAIWVGVRRFSLGAMLSPAAVITPVMLGSSAFLAECALLYKGAGGAAYALPFLVGALGLGGLVSETFRKETRTHPASTPCALASALALVAGITAVNLPLILLGAAAAWGSFFAFAARPRARKESRRTEAATGLPAAAEDETAPALHEDTPELLRGIETLVSQDTPLCLCVCGPTGCGKTHAVHEAVRSCPCVAAAGFEVFQGACPPASADAAPYAPFAEAFKKHLPPRLFAAGTHSAKVIDDAFTKVFDSIVPFSKMLFPERKNDTGGNRQEIHIAVLNFIKNTAGRKKVLFLLDAVQDMDPASRELLHFLLERLDGEGITRIKFILVARGASAFGAIPKPDRLLVEFAAPGPDFVRAMLERRFKLSPDCAAKVVGMVGSDGTDLNWITELVADMVRRECFVQRKDGLEFTEQSDQALLPADMSGIISGELLGDARLQPVFQCAACAGYTLKAGILGEALGMPRLELLQILDRIQNETGWIQELPGEHDTYRFRSTLVFEAFRNRYGVHGTGPTDASVPQLIREYHALLGRALENAQSRGEGDAYQMANQFYLAGPREAERAVRHCLGAARIASSQFMPALAMDFCHKAEEYLPFTDMACEVEQARVVVLCNEAHHEGKDSGKAIAAAEAFLTQGSGHGFEVHFMLMRALYDMGGMTGDQACYRRCHALAARCVETFEAPHEKAVAFQFQGISLPPADRDGRRTALEKARECIAGAGEHDTEALRVYARVLNSLAEEYSRGDNADKAKARAMFLRSIELKKRPDIADTMGLALSHGGLGRLALFSQTPDYDLARRHFSEDLAYCEKIGNVSGVGKMHSFIGRCDIGGGQWADALGHFQQALATAQGILDTVFALTGLMEAALGLDDERLLAQYGTALADACPEKTALPGMCVNEVARVLGMCAGHAAQEWHIRCSGLLPAS